MWHGRTVSVVLPTYNERDSIRQSIVDILALGVADEVLVINNNAAPGTSEEVAHTAAREIHEPLQGYGNAIRRGFREATGDLLIVSEPDGTFLGRDILKLLAYADDFDVVYGSRTARMFIWRGANMGLFLRWGNWAVAKLMEFLFNSTNLTDVGCTMRLIHRQALREIEPDITIGGSSFGPEMMILTLLHGQKLIQIPVNYLPRVGESSVTGDFRKAFFLGLTMIALVLRYRVRSWLRLMSRRARAGGTA
jgi:glycosyltransferase involved in cell wall biosynthesis